ncbi:EamA-like transporter family protein [filamentous cyanobacterium CCP5]|nr:EamA-like transporter family protein [filamentous cyanobacterium CCP5]
MNDLGVFFLAVLGGVAIAIQGQFMGLMTQIMGPRESILVTYAGGMAIAVLLVLSTQDNNLKAWPLVPWYALTAGAFGLIIVGTIGFVVPRLGLATGFGVIVATQFIFGVLIDQFGLFGADIRPIDLPKLVGLGLIVSGVALMGR